MYSSRTVETLAARLEAAPVLVLLLDYDGTLVPFAPTPDLAEPDDELIGLLRGLAARPDTEIHIVSGRTRETLERWLGALPIGLHAEHGFLSRPPGAAEWVSGMLPSQDWRPAALALMRDVRGAHAGSSCRGEKRRTRMALPPGRPGARPEPGSRPDARAVHAPRPACPPRSCPARRSSRWWPEASTRAASSPPSSPALPRARWSWPSGTTAPTRTCSPRCRPTALAVHVGPEPTVGLHPRRRCPGRPRPSPHHRGSAARLSRDALSWK